MYSELLITVSYAPRNASPDRSRSSHGNRVASAARGPPPLVPASRSRDTATPSVRVSAGPGTIVLDRNRISRPAGLLGRSTICRANACRAVSVAITPLSSSTVISTGSVIPGRPRSNWIDRAGPGSRCSTASPLVQVHCRIRPPSGGYQPVPQPIASRSR